MVFEGHGAMIVLPAVLMERRVLCACVLILSYSKNGSRDAWTCLYEFLSARARL